MKEFQQLDSQNFHIGPTVNYDWAGAMDIPAPEYNKQTERARWDAEKEQWDIKTKEEWGEILNPPDEEEIEA